MKPRSHSFSRTPEDLAKFRCLVQTLVWVYDKAGKSPAEVVSMTLRKGKTVLENACYF